MTQSFSKIIISFCNCKSPVTLLREYGYSLLGLGISKRIRKKKRKGGDERRKRMRKEENLGEKKRMRNEEEERRGKNKSYERRGWA